MHFPPLKVIDEKAASSRNKPVQKMPEIIFSPSSTENLALFQMASRGVRYNFFLLEKSGISRKQYYRGLRALKEAGQFRQNEMSEFIKKMGANGQDSFCRTSAKSHTAHAASTLLHTINDSYVATVIKLFIM
jgi:hypothetical protein